MLSESEDGGRTTMLVQSAKLTSFMLFVLVFEHQLHIVNRKASISCVKLFVEDDLNDIKYGFYTEYAQVHVDRRPKSIYSRKYNNLDYYLHFANANNKLNMLTFYYKFNYEGKNEI